VRKNVLSIF